MTDLERELVDALRELADVSEELAGCDSDMVGYADIGERFDVALDQARAVLAKAETQC